MKKLLFIALLFIGFGLNAQSVKYDYRTIQTLDTFNISTVDTSWTFGTTDHYTGAVQVYWTEFVGTLDADFTMQGSIDGVNYFDLNMSAYTPVDTVGSAAWHITAGTGTDYDYIRLFFDRNSVSAGKVILSVRFNK